MKNLVMSIIKNCLKGKNSIANKIKLVYNVDNTLEGSGVMLQPGAVWLIAVVAFVAVEAVTYQMVSIWFAVGAAGGLVAHVCGAGLPVQIGVFIVLSVIMFAALRPLSMRLAKKRRFKSNAESLEGKTVLITEEVNNLNGTGKGKVDSMEWTVRTANDKIISPGTTARVIRIEGVKLIVE